MSSAFDRRQVITLASSSTIRQQQLHRTTPLEAYEHQLRIILNFSALSTEQQDKHACPTPKSCEISPGEQEVRGSSRPNVSEFPKFSDPISFYPFLP